MAHKKIKIFLLVFLLILTSFTFQDKVSASGMALAELIELARENNRPYRQLEQELQEAEAQEGQLESGLDWRGDVVGDLDIQETPEVLKSFYDRTEEDIDDTLAMASLTVALSRDLLADPETEFQREAIALDIKDSLLALEREEQELIVSIAEAYYELLQAQVGLELARQAEEVSKEQVEAKEVLLEAEEATETDLKEVELEVQEAKNAREEAEEMVSLARENLQRELGEEPLPEVSAPLPLTAAEELELPEKASPWPWDLTTSKEIAREERIEIKRLEQALKLSQAEEERIVGENRPDYRADFIYNPEDIDIFLNASLDESGRLITGLTRTESNLPDFPGVEDLEDEDIEEILEEIADYISDELNGFPSIPEVDGDNNAPLADYNYSVAEAAAENNNNTNNDNDNGGLISAGNNSSFWQLSFSVEYNFYDSGLEEEEIKEVEARKRGQEEELAEAKEGIALEVEAQWQELESAYRELQRDKSNLDLSKSRLSDGEHMLETEMITEYEFNMLELNYYQAASEVINSYYDFRQEQAELALALGLEADWYKGELE